MPNRFISIIKQVIVTNLLFAIFLTVIATFLIFRALPENHIDFESAENIMAVRWWNRDGLFQHHFLMLFAGYGKVIRYFDEPNLNENAQGSAAGSFSSGSPGHKLNYYTHYPSFFLLPAALIMKLGTENLFILRFPSIIAAILGLIFLYVFITFLSNKYIALIGVLYFGISPIFIKWADMIQYESFEDMWRFLILLLSLLTFNYFNDNKDLKNKYLYLLAIWISYFLLALTSFNSDFFIFTWLAGLSGIYIFKNPNVVKKIRSFIFSLILWALAPIFGFVLQLFQNISYLGWRNALLDIYGAFSWAGNRIGLGFLTRIEALIRPFFSMTGIYDFYVLTAPLGLAKIKKLIIQPSGSAVFILLLFSLITILAIIRLKKITKCKILSPLIIGLLAVAPLSQILILPYTGFREYMGRLFAPFIGIIIGTISYMIFLIIFDKIKLSISDRILFCFVFMATLSFFTIQIILNNVSGFYPSYAPISPNDIAFSKSMQKIVAGEKAVFMINKSDTQIPEEEFKKRLALYNLKYVQPNYTIWEYYFDMPLLNFAKSFYLIRDLTYLEKRAEFPFAAIVTSDNSDLIGELYGNLKNKKLPLSQIKTLENRYYFIVSPVSKKDSLQNINPAPTAPDTGIPLRAPLAGPIRP